MKSIQKMFILSVLVALASQVNLELLESDFVVSAGVVFLVIFLYHYEDISPVPFGIISGLMVFLLRLAVHQVMIGGVNLEVADSYMPEIVFYSIYAIFFMLFLEYNRKNNLGFVFIVFIISDFSSNLFELFVRYTILGETILLEVIPTLLVVSVIRSSVVWIVLTALNYYNMILAKREHEDRYKKLLLYTSQLKTEMYWIEKNIGNLENLMSKSNELYEKINSEKDCEEWADMTLAIVEELKEIKNYNSLVVQGMKDISEKGLNDSGMEYKDISSILSEIMDVETKDCDKNIDIEFEIGENFYTSKHYYLISVLRNLILNSMESIRKAQKNAKISITHKKDDFYHVFKVTDNGSGIDKDFKGEVFKPGFSTKVNSETGEVCRGLGLSTVHYIVEEQLHGKVEIDSEFGKGTTVTFSIPKSTLEQEVIKVV